MEDFSRKFSNNFVFKKIKNCFYEKLFKYVFWVNFLNNLKTSFKSCLNNLNA